MKISLTLIAPFLVTGAFAEDLTLCVQDWQQSQAGNHQKALELYAKGVETGNLSKASLARTHRNMGISSKEDKQLKKAIEFYNKALALKPKDPWDDCINRGNPYDLLGGPEKALKDYGAALKALVRKLVEETLEQRHDPKKALGMSLI
ncbi:MAG: tetratricopeptide repeat protein [Akkermansiaceae bacterium]|jgi:tetratricopeptide (TPR) repeat protein